MSPAASKFNTKQLLIETAIDLFREFGTDKVSIKDICDRSKLTRNAFYYHFENKDQLFDAIADYIVSLSKQRVVNLYGLKNSYMQIWEFYKAYLSTELEMGPDIMNQICIARTVNESSDYSSYSYVDEDMANTMSALIADAQKSGQIRNMTDPMQLMWASYAIIRGTNIKWCFVWGKSDLLKEAWDNLATLFLPDPEILKEDCQDPLPPEA